MAVVWCRRHAIRLEATIRGPGRIGWESACGLRIVVDVGDTITLTHARGDPVDIGSRDGRLRRIRACDRPRTTCEEQMEAYRLFKRHARDDEVREWGRWSGYDVNSPSWRGSHDPHEARLLSRWRKELQRGPPPHFHERTTLVSAVEMRRKSRISTAGVSCRRERNDEHRIVIHIRGYCLSVRVDGHEVYRVLSLGTDSHFESHPTPPRVVRPVAEGDVRHLRACVRV